MPLTGYPSIIGDRKPSYIDTTTSTIFYEGYESGQDFIICKIDLSTPVITRTWASGLWADRTTLTFN